MLRWVVPLLLLAGCATPAADLDAAAVPDAGAAPTRTLVNEVVLVYDITVFAPLADAWILEPAVERSACEHGTVLIVALEDGSFHSLAWGGFGPRYATRENATTMTLGLNVTGIDGDLLLCVLDDESGELLAATSGPAPLAVELANPAASPTEVIVSTTQAARVPSGLATLTLDARWYADPTA